MKVTAENRLDVQEMMENLQDAAQYLEFAELKARWIGNELYRKSAMAKRRSVQKLVRMLAVKLDAYDAKAFAGATKEEKEMVLSSKETYAGVIGDIVRDDRTCDVCQRTIYVNASAITSRIFACSHLADSVTAALNAAGVVYSDEGHDGERNVVTINRWTNRAVLAVR